jgi:nucleoside-diphosphate-sugar epimerase
MHSCILVTGGAGFVGSSLALALKVRFPESIIAGVQN